LQGCYWKNVKHLLVRNWENRHGEPKNHLTANSLKWYCKTMNMTAEKLVSEALQMPNTVRAFVAERIIESLDFGSDVDLSPEWKAEIDKRCREMDEGAVSLIDADEVFKKAYARLS
jgi:putative addiction module component (TIGR02574 family)